MEKNSLKHMCPYTQIQAPFAIIVSVVVSLLKNVTIAYTNISVEQYDFTADWILDTQCCRLLYTLILAVIWLITSMCRR